MNLPLGTHPKNLAQRLWVIVLSTLVVSQSLLVFLMGKAGAHEAWVQVADLSSPRFAHTATFLSGPGCQSHCGKVLLAGGKGAFSSLEVVDPSSSSRTTLDLGLSPRSEHSATLLGSGEVLIAGGGWRTNDDESILDSAVVLAPDLSSLTHTQMTKARKQHRATLLEGSGCGMNCNRVLVTGGVGADLMRISLAAAEFFDPATGQWSDAGLLSTGRYRHTATLLSNGKVLVTGGTDSDGFSIASAELFDPAIAIEPQEADIPSGANGVWLPAQSMEFPRAGHTASVLPDGNVLVVGGERLGGGPVAEAEIYNVNSGTWQRAGEMPFPTSLHSADVLPDGRVVAIGGRNGEGDAAARSQIYSNGEWSVGENMESARMHHTTTDLPSGKLLVAGGSIRDDFNVRALKSAELFDPLGAFPPPTPIPPLITEVDPSSGPVSGGTPATILGSGFTNATQVLFGSQPASSFKINSDEQITAVSPPHPPQGVQVMVTSPSGTSQPNAGTRFTYMTAEAGSWSDAASLLTARSSHTAISLSDGRVLVTGGLGPGGAAIASAEIFEPALNLWRPTGSLSIPRFNHSATSLKDGRVLVTGGLSAIQGLPSAVNSAEIYDPATGTWLPAGFMDVARESHTATLMPNGSVLVAGGSGPCDENDQGRSLSSTEIFEPGTGRWDEGPPMAQGRAGHTDTALSNGEILVIGGYRGCALDESPEGSMAQPETFDGNQWKSAGEVLVPRFFHTATPMADGKVLVAGGYPGNIELGATRATPLVELYGGLVGWTPIRSLGTSRARHTATPLPGGSILVAGGATRGDGVSLNISEIYSDAIPGWGYTASLRQERHSHTANLIQGYVCGSNCGKVLVAGGAAGDQPLSSAELFTGPTPITAPGHVTDDDAAFEKGNQLLEALPVREPGPAVSTTSQTRASTFGRRFGPRRSNPSSPGAPAVAADSSPPRIEPARPEKIAAPRPGPSKRAPIPKVGNKAPDWLLPVLLSIGMVTLAALGAWANRRVHRPRSRLSSALEKDGTGTKI